MTAEFPQLPAEQISDLTAVARDSFADHFDFVDARSRAAARAAERNLGSVSLADQFAEFDAQRGSAEGQLPPPPTDSHQ